MRIRVEIGLLHHVFGIVVAAEDRIAGLDKFFNILTNWEQYASPLLINLSPISAGAMMRVAGVIEMIAGIAVLAGLTRLGGYVVAAWLTLIALTLVSSGRFLDVAVRDLVMAIGALTLARLSAAQQHAIVAT